LNKGIFEATIGLPNFILSNSFFVDVISIPFVLLSTFLIFLCSLVNWNIRFQIKEFSLLLLLTEWLLVNAFTVSNLLWFYILFEAVLIPIFMIIGIFGSRIDKISAAYQLFMYTVAGAILFLGSLLLMFNLAGSLNYFYLKSVTFPIELEKFFFLSFFLVLAVKYLCSLFTYGYLKLMLRHRLPVVSY
jgi:NADH:ubiquinone oxidoreductase subunit 4 (subunit M)